MDTPVLLLTFNRPDLAKAQIDRLRAIGPRSLYVASDGPRKNNTSDERAVHECRRLFGKSIDWECTVYSRYGDENAGCGRGVSSAITWFFENVERGIIVEDDCALHPSFFGFASEMLERYVDEPGVGGISADFKFLSNDRPASEYGFTRFPQIWGWATWRRVWRHYKFQLDSADIAEVSKRLKDLPSASQRYWIEAFRKVQAGRIDTWDYQLAHVALVRRLQFIHPMRNLVTNVGFDVRATHTRDSQDETSLLPVFEVGGPYVANKSYRDYDEYLATKYFTHRSFVHKILRRILSRMRASSKS